MSATLVFLAHFVALAACAKASEPCDAEGCADTASNEEAVAAHVSLIQAKRNQASQPVGSSCDTCRNGYGTWQHYDDPKTVVCICKSCKNGFHMTDMFCEPDAIVNGMKYRLTNSRFGSTVCLDHHGKDGSVAAYPRNDHGGQVWTAEATGKDGVFRFTNDRFGAKVCLDHHAKGSVSAYPCDNNGGDDWKLGGFPYTTYTQLTNARFGNEACLDNHKADGTVIMASCDEHGGDSWTFEPQRGSNQCIPIGDPCKLDYKETALGDNFQFEHPSYAESASFSQSSHQNPAALPCCDDEIGTQAQCVNEGFGFECASP